MLDSSPRPSGLGSSPGFGVAARSRLEIPSILLGLDAVPLLAVAAAAVETGIDRPAELSVTRDTPPPADNTDHSWSAQRCE
jgi:hypothetical protein